MFSTVYSLTQPPSSLKIPPRTLPEPCQNAAVGVGLNLGQRNLLLKLYHQGSGVILFPDVDCHVLIGHVLGGGLLVGVGFLAYTILLCIL